MNTACARTVFCVLSAALFLCACTADATKEKLAAADTLLYEERADTALMLLRGIRDADIKSDKDAAYFSLLMGHALYVSDEAAQAEAAIDKSLAYYERHTDDRLLPRAYYYKGELMCQRDSVSGGIVYIKRAEQTVGENDSAYRHHIYESLAYYNYISGGYGLSLSYSKKALALSEKMRKTDWQLYALNLATQNLVLLGRTDEAAEYMGRIIPLMRKASEKGRKFVLNDISRYFHLVDPEKAERLIGEALRNSPDGVTCAIAAAIYYNKGDKEKAERLIQNALELTRSRQKLTVWDTLMKMRAADGEYEEAYGLALRLAPLNDSVQNRIRERDIQRIQNDFDSQLREEKVRRIVAFSVSGVVCLSLLTAALAVYSKYRRIRFRQRLYDDRLQIEGCNRRIEELERSSCENEKAKRDRDAEIRRLRKEVNDIEKKYSGALADGKARYEEIMSGKTTVLWDKGNFRNFVEYYKLVDNVLVSQLETRYKGLSCKVMTFAILENLGFGNAEISRIMRKSVSSLRTARSRMAKRRPDRV